MTLWPPNLCTMCPQQTCVCWFSEKQQSAATVITAHWHTEYCTASELNQKRNSQRQQSSEQCMILPTISIACCILKLIKNTTASSRGTMFKSFIKHTHCITQYGKVQYSCCTSYKYVIMWCLVHQVGAWHIIQFESDSNVDTYMSAVPGNLREKPG